MTSKPPNKFIPHSVVTQKTVVGVAPTVKGRKFTNYKRSPVISFVVFKAVSFKDSVLLGYEAASSVSKDSSTLEIDYLLKRRHMPADRNYEIRFQWWNRCQMKDMSKILRKCP